MSKSVQKKSKKVTVRKASNLLRYVVLDSEQHWLDELGKEETAVCRTRDEVLKVIDRIDADSLWISRHSERTEELAKTRSRARRD